MLKDEMGESNELTGTRSAVVAAVRTDDDTDDRLKASSQKRSSSLLTCRASSRQR